MAEINKKSLEHLADLARLELHEKESDKFLKDLSEILGHFKELETLNTDGVQPMTGGTELRNILREDEILDDRLGPDNVVDSFPEKEGRHLKVPPVF
ncbi:MAG: Asp-tRNA(Asn)/Glu-tRNA(Gln) amidotransferase subunit GatC [Patescibacteria group bacterium]